ncbi:Leo1-like protein [Dendrothele bispora CBS 962.96]|uniref:Leo1-like protein n=1 Tax=Dendrothele bispora (strain CBS 962.96) TaxID=1314807 RepID=A0A4S8LQ13_DENBC|nr:Leo1-like protein [Dendrothele bispora CBS 962.96]
MSSLAGALIPPEDSLPPSQDQHFYEDDKDDPIPDRVRQDEDEEMTDLFGNDAPAVVEDASSARSDSEPADADQRRALEYEEDENEIPPELAVEVREANVSFPNIPVPRSSDGDNWVIRMPNFVKLDSKPFHPDTYMGPEHDEDENPSHSENVREKSMSIKLKVENTVRWRWNRDKYGNESRQSNSRIIRWSDGTLSLRLGKEFFDITQSIDTSAAVARQTLGGRSQSQSQPSQSQSQSQSQLAGKSQGLTYLVAQHKRSEVLQAEAVITGYMSLRPTSMQSETHRMLVRAVGQKHNKVARLRMAPDPTMDPEKEKMELLKQNAKKTKRRNAEDSYSAAARSKRQRRKSEGYYSDDMDGPGYGQSEDEDESAIKRKKNGEERGEYQEDGFVVADESDEDEDYGVRRRKKEEEDPLDRIDAKIEKRQRKAGIDEDDEEDETMEVESEEEDQKVRRAGANSRRKHALYEEDDD